MKEILALSAEELQVELAAAGGRAFAARQVCRWVYGKAEPDIGRWSDISLELRRSLAGRLRVTGLTPLHREADADGTEKFLFGLPDGRRIEAVRIPEPGHLTFCLSTQVGCPLGCRFCATGRMGFLGNLSSAEILGQLFFLRQGLGPETQTINLVFMGMGEPLLNYDNLAAALRRITAEDGFHISPRRITVSTAGILAPLRRLEEEFPLVKIAFSLNAPEEKLRGELMPHSRAHPLAPILEHFRSHKRRFRITFEYVLLAGQNDSPAQARRLVKLLHGIPAKLNLIPYNESAGGGFQAPDEAAIQAFQKVLVDRGLTAVVRWSKGRGIRSACGQLAGGN